MSISAGAGLAATASLVGSQCAVSVLPVVAMFGGYWLQGWLLYWHGGRGQHPAKWRWLVLRWGAFLAVVSTSCWLPIRSGDQHGHGVANWQPLGTKLAWSSLYFECTALVVTHGIMACLAIRCYGAWRGKCDHIGYQAKTNSGSCVIGRCFACQC